jgi:hypothetical protein
MSVIRYYCVNRIVRISNWILIQNRLQFIKGVYKIIKEYITYNGHGPILSTWASSFHCVAQLPFSIPRPTMLSPFLPYHGPHYSPGPTASSLLPKPNGPIPLDKKPLPRRAAMPGHRTVWTVYPRQHCCAPRRPDLLLLWTLCSWRTCTIVPFLQASIDRRMRNMP